MRKHIKKAKVGLASLSICLSHGDANESAFFDSLCEQNLEEMISRGPPIVGGKLIMSDKYKEDIFALPLFGSLLPTTEEWKKAKPFPKQHRTWYALNSYSDC